MLKKLILLSLFTLSLGATCVPSGSNRHLCLSTGDSVVDGTDLKNYLTNHTYVCGDTIIVSSGAYYDTPTTPGAYYPFALTAQPECLPGQRTHLVSTRAKELAYTRDKRCTHVDSRANYLDPLCTTWPLMNDIPKMAVLRNASGACQSCSGGVLASYPGPATGWLIEGIVFSTDANVSLVDHTYVGLNTVGIGSGTNSNPLAPSDFSYDIEFLHCLTTNGEEENYGTLADCKTINCLLRGSAGAWGLAGRKIRVTESSAFGQGGFLPYYGSVLSAVVLVDGGGPHPGTGYAVGDTFTINGGNAAALATGTVATITGGGGTGPIGTVTITYGGFGYGSYGYSGSGITNTTGSGTGAALFVSPGDSVHFPITAATNEISPIVTVTGIATLLDLVPVTPGSCVDPDSGRPRCTAGCLLNNMCERVMVQGLPSGDEWNDANGLVYGIYESANSIRLVTANFAELYTKDTYPYYKTIDTTTSVSYPGGAVVRPAGPTIDPVYNLYPQTTNDLQFVRSYIENADMTYFAGSGGAPTSYGLITASTWDGVDTGTLSVTVELGGPLGVKIGDVVAFETSTQSHWCHGTPTCPTTTQSGIIQSFAGTFPNLVFTLRPWGPTGMDVPALTGSGHRAVWQGLLAERILMSEGTIYRDPFAFPVGKGQYEAKNAKTSLFQGMLTGCMFYEGKNQSYAWITGMSPAGGNAVWATCANTHWSHNIMNGCNLGHMNSGDYEATVTKDFNCHYEHNLAPSALTLAEYPNQSYMYSLSNTSTARHNTSFVNYADSLRDTTFVNFYVPIDCNVPTSETSFNQLYSQTFGLMYNNLMSWGVGYVSSAVGQNCWPNEFSSVFYNVALNDDPLMRVTNSDIVNRFPGMNNQAATNIAAIDFVGGATPNVHEPLEWELNSSSPYKGAANDGSDPGADVVALVDRFNGYSRKAGLLEYDAMIAQFSNKPSAFHITSTTNTLTFRRFKPLSECRVILYTDPARVNVDADTAISGDRLCSRAGNSTNNGGVISFVLGNVVALTPNTTYYYEVQDGSGTASVRRMPGSFKTKP